jgi:PAS domain S-box-containing protein
MQNVSKTEGELKLFTDKKFKTLNILFMVSLFIILVLFFFLIFSFYRYSKKRINAEQNLIYAKNSLDTVVNAIDSMLISCDKHNIVSLWNNAVSQFTGIPQTDAIGKDLFELLPMLNNYKSLINKVYHSQHPEELYREKIEFSNGEEKIYDIKLHYTQGLNNVVIKIDDVTEHAVKDEQLRQSQKMSVVSNMINGLVHSFNNVLGAILGTVTMMKFSVKKKHIDWETFQENVDVIESSSEKAGLMLEQILSLTKNKPPKKEMMDLN